MIDKLKELDAVEVYFKENYKDIDWIDVAEFKKLVNKFPKHYKKINDNCCEIESINEEKVIKDYNDISILKFFRYVPAFLHKHDFFEIIYVYSGECRCYIDGKEIILCGGDIIFIPPFVKHATFCAREEDILIKILIRSSTFDKSFFELLTFNSILSDFFGKVIYSNSQSTHLIFHTGEDENIKKLIVNMFEETEKKLKYESTILNGILMIFFGYLMRNYEDNIEISRDFNDKFEKFDDILEYIYKNFATVTLDDLSREFKFDKFYISKVIKSYTGRNFISIVQDIKMRKATELIISTNLSMESIGNAVGYTSTPTFIRTFKKIYNMSPSEYRKYKIKQK